MKQYSLLVVDDNKPNIAIIKDGFEKEGYKIYEAYDGESAINIALQNKPDLILLDINLPIKDGFEVCKFLKSNEETSHIHIIFLTGRNSNEDKVTAFDVGGVDYITKPFDIRDVKARVNTQKIIKQIRDELLSERDKLSAANEYTESILNNMPVSVCVIDQTGVIKTVNNTFRETFASVESKYIDSSFDKVFSSFKSSRIEKKESFVSFINKALLNNSEIINEEVCFSFDGVEKFFIFSFKKLSSGNFIVTFIETTDLKKIEQELVIQSRLKYIGEIVIGVTHEINNPNTFIRVNYKNILMILDLLKPVFDKLKTENIKVGNFDIDEVIDRLERANEGIYQASEKILYVIERLKNFAKKDSKVAELIDIKDIVSEALMLTTYFVAKNVDICVELEDNLPKISGTSIELVQVLVNLITNSYHSIEEKIEKNIPDYTKGKILISGSNSVDTKEIVIKISDNGLGIPDEIKEKVFNPFFTTKPQGKGTGLGLALCYGTIGRYKGTINFVSVSGEKTEFIIKLPYN
jgi:signal transduction histidine kinase/ActR/RegA family two-component response regulator